MRWFVLAWLACLATAAPCSAKSPQTQERKMGISISPGEVTPTPEMWFYEQSMRNYQDPKMAVRQRAEFQAAERTRRLTSLRWYGMSNSRPQAGGDLLHGQYSPYWSSGHTYFPFRWSGAGGSTVVVPSRSATARSD